MDTLRQFDPSGLARGLAIGLALAASACAAPYTPGPATTTTTPGENAVPSTSEPESGKHVAVAITSEQFSPPDADPPKSHVFAVVTDHVGNVTNTAIGDYIGVCAALPVEPDDVVTFQCWWAGSGTKLRGRVSQGNLVILREEVDEHTAPNPLACIEVTRISIPTGIRVEAAPPVVPSTPAPTSPSPPPPSSL